MRSRWTDVSLDWVDYQEARVEALASENQTLRRRVAFLRKVLQDVAHERGEIVVESDGADLPSVLVRTMPVPPPPRPEMIQ